MAGSYAEVSLELWVVGVLECKCVCVCVGVGGCRWVGGWVGWGGVSVLGCPKIIFGVTRTVGGYSCTR